MTKEIELRIKEEHQRLADLRGLDSTYCPSEVARNLFHEDWRDQMDNVRIVADQMIENELLVEMQKGNVINELATTAKGPIRLRRFDGSKDQR